MDINGINPSSQTGNVASSPQNQPMPAGNDVSAFNRAMGAEGKNCDSCSSSNGGTHTGEIPQDVQQQLIQLLQQLLQMLQGGEPGGAADSASGTGKTHGGSTAGPDGGVSPVTGSGPGGSAGSDELIPKPTEHIQTLNLGGKNVTVGGDGTSSAQEVAATANQVQHLYDNSPTFKNMIDNSSDPSFEVSVGRRSDNTSWGNTQGRVFMNINNVDPGNSDTFQSLMGHEFAHASVDMPHGSAIEQTQNAVAQEA
ncbi:MAG TPA: hypothetical protein PLB10_18355 [Thiolinea sp.]|nr:hypothetical protein [Thiolinea sp.]